MLIGILQCGHAPEKVQEKFGNYSDMFAKFLDGHGFTFKVWNVVDGDHPSTPEDADGWLVTGSKHGAYEDHDWIPPLEDFIRAVYASDRNMVGVCFGHQIIAQALGGRVEKFSDGWALGHKHYDMQGGGTLAVNAWHQDQVITVPESGTTVAGNNFCKNAAIIYGNKIYTTQPHPEFSVDMMKTFVADRKDLPEYPRDLMNQAVDKLGSPIDDTTIANDFASMLKGTFAVPHSGAA